MFNPILESIGLRPFFQRQCDSNGVLKPYRITEDYGTRFVVLGELDGRLEELDLVVQGRQDVLPVIGDWVLAREIGDGRVLLDGIMNRENSFRRVRSQNDVQALASNVTQIFITTSCNEEFNLSRLERYLLLARDAGVSPYVVLNKTDLVDDYLVFTDRLREIDRSLPCIPVNTRSADGIRELVQVIQPNDTCVFLGSSGVGKSSLINSLLGVEAQLTLEVSAKGARGSHTTTSRRLFRLPRGGVVIDTPGIRSVGVGDNRDSLDDAFNDVVTLAKSCAFGNCRHSGEAGCRIALAIETGEITQRRFDSYRKLQREVSFFEAPEEARREQKQAWRRTSLNWKQRQKFEGQM